MDEIVRSVRILRLDLLHERAFLRICANRPGKLPPALRHHAGDLPPNRETYEREQVDPDGARQQLDSLEQHWQQ